jgi:hypothetical protein
MKKIILILIAFALPLCWWSCEEVLDKVPDSQITLEEVLSDYTRSKGLLDRAYENVYTARDQIIHFFTPFDALTDNTHRSDIYWGSKIWHDGGLTMIDQVISENNTGARNQLWPDFWQGIRKANLAIKYLPQSTAIAAEECSRWVAEARVLRCWYYMNLLEFYGPMPWVPEPFEEDYTGWNDLTRPSYDDVATTISNELMDVIGSGILSNRLENQEFHRVGNGVAYAIRARVLLNNASPLNNPDNDPAKWQRAANAAQDVIALPEFSLVPMAEYKTLFTSQTPASEVIWWGAQDNVHINNVNAVNVGAYPFSKIPSTHMCGECPTQELVDCFEMKNGALPVTYTDATHLRVQVNPNAALAGYSEDPASLNEPGIPGAPYANRDARFYVDILFNNANYGKPYNCNTLGDYIIETFVGGKNGIQNVFINDARETNTGYYNCKDTQIEAWGPNLWPSGGQKPTHWVLFRLAEFYLNKAEALCELNRLDEAMEALNEVRTRALQPRIQDVPGFVVTQNNLRARIRNERRVEFCMEGWRFHDQRRWKILEETNRLVTGMRITKSGGMLHYERVKIRDYESYTDKYLVMPIPLNDAKKMTGMSQPEAWR